VIGDLVVRDRALIERIESGVRQISAGYDCQYTLSNDGRRYEQRNIRINHISVLKKGRAGSNIAIMDSALLSFDSIMAKFTATLERAARIPSLRPVVEDFVSELQQEHYQQVRDAAAENAVTAAQQYAAEMRKLFRR
jgi:hypothetical protein